MASEAKRERIAQSRKTVGHGFSAPPEEPEHPLSDPQTQHEIMHPEPVRVRIAGEMRELFPLSARRRMAFIGLIQGIVASCWQDDVRIGNAAMMELRMRSIIAERYLERIAPFIAAATTEPGELKQQEIDHLASELLGESGIRYDEISGIVDALTVQNGVWDEIQRAVVPKA